METYGLARAEADTITGQLFIASNTAILDKHTLVSQVVKGLLHGMDTKRHTGRCEKRLVTQNAAKAIHPGRPRHTAPQVKA